MKTKINGTLTTAYIRGIAVAYADMNTWRTWFKPGAQKLLTSAEYKEIETWSEQMRELFHTTHRLRK